MISKDSKLYLFAVVSIGFGLLIGLGLGYLLGSLAKNQAYQLGLEQGRTESEKKYQEKISQVFPSFPEPEEIFSVSGEIKEIGEKVLVLEERICDNPLMDCQIKTWRIKISGSTEILKNVLKTPEELAKEMEKGPAVPFKEMETDFAEFAVGKRMTAEAGENIKGKSEFEATKIILQE